MTSLAPFPYLQSQKPMATQATSPQIEVKREFEAKPIPIRPSPVSPVKIAVSGSLSVSGVAEPPGSAGKVAFSRGKAEVEAELETELCTIGVKQEIEPGKLSQFSITIGKKGIPVKIEIDPHADFRKPLTFKIEPSEPITLAEVKLRVGPGEPYTFKGEMLPELIVEVEMNELWPAGETSPGWPLKGRVARCNRA